MVGVLLCRLLCVSICPIRSIVLILIELEYWMLYCRLELDLVWVFKNCFMFVKLSMAWAGSLE